jgi:hypothetical protein
VWVQRFAAWGHSPRRGCGDWEVFLHPTVRVCTVGGLRAHARARARVESRDTHTRPYQCIQEQMREEARCRESVGAARRADMAVRLMCALLL